MIYVMSARCYDRASAVQEKFRPFWFQVHSCSFLNEMLNRIFGVSFPVVNVVTFLSFQGPLLELGRYPNCWPLVWLHSQGFCSFWKRSR
jgi:hypothetical protein